EAMRLEAAKKAALDYFEAAGCELNAARTSIIEFPEDVSNSYEVYITGGSAGKHPSYLLLTMTSDMLRSVGINLIIKDVSSQAEMYRAVLSGEADMWCAAWNGEVLSGIRSRFSSLGAENYFGLSDEVIDQRITIAGASLTHELYKSALDAVLDSAVIIPVYQRKMNSVFGGALDHNTIEGDLTAHYGYADVIWKIKILSE
ncbi:MAG: hypothetical protein FWE60_05970, partial [Oscillospiraceae bacterium]|nr:hypothetical protein [Oscillospiraceae bacterium]